MTAEKGFYWKRFAEVEKLFLKMIADCRKESITISRFEEKLLQHTSTRLLDWVDHFIMPNSDQLRNTLETLGFIGRTSEGIQYYSHTGVSLPPVLLSQNSSPGQTGIALRVESISDFLQANSFSADIEGSCLSPYRWTEISHENGTSMCAVERRGTRVFEPVYKEDSYPKDYWAAIEAWKNMPRWHNDEEAAFTEISNQATKIIGTLGKNSAAHVVCLAERDYWLSRNFAGRMQKSRHNNLGLGWANHDHHTFRSSRQHFARHCAATHLPDASYCNVYFR